MILVDFSQIAISSVMTQTKMQKKVDEGMFRHILLNSLRQNRAKFNKDYGELVICADSKESWRKDVFPHYKANRKKSRDASAIDWKEVFRVIDIVKGEIIETFPYKFINLPGAEGDDIIATLVMNNLTEKNLILSSDKDFIQLQKHSNVFQYDFVRNKWIKDKNPELFLREHIIRGDTSDGVPNILSCDDALSNGGKKQKSIFKKHLEVWLQDAEDVFYNNLPSDQQSNYSRNKMMIDLERIPTHITEGILREYSKEIEGSRGKILGYFIKNRLRELTKVLHDF